MLLHYPQRRPNTQPFILYCIVCTRFNILHCFFLFALLVCISVPFISLIQTHACKTAIVTYWLLYFYPRPENQEVSKIQWKRWNREEIWPLSARNVYVCLPHLLTPVGLTQEVRAISSVISAVRCRWCMILSCPLKLQRVGRDRQTLG
jgi:hypothetical protein